MLQTELRDPGGCSRVGMVAGSRARWQLPELLAALAAHAEDRDQSVVHDPTQCAAVGRARSARRDEAHRSTRSPTPGSARSRSACRLLAARAGRHSSSDTRANRLAARARAPCGFLRRQRRHRLYLPRQHEIVPRDARIDHRPRTGTGCTVWLRAPAGLPAASRLVGALARARCATNAHRCSCSGSRN